MATEVLVSNMLLRHPNTTENVYFSQLDQANNGVLYPGRATIEGTTYQPSQERRYGFEESARIVFGVNPRGPLSFPNDFVKADGSLDIKKVQEWASKPLLRVIPDEAMRPPERKPKLNPGSSSQDP
jgi:hypothetical protein